MSLASDLSPAPGPAIFSLPDEATIAAADYAMRNWQGPSTGSLAAGSQAYKNLFCTMFLETHNPYKPAIIQWPHLNEDEHRRVTGLPIWDLAVQTEGHAGTRVKGYAATLTDPLLHDATLMNGNEEARHKEVLHHMVRAYGVKLAPEPDYPPPDDAEWGFMITGFSECIDSFFAFGLFALAKQSGFFPPALVDTFEPVMQEECRHIMFFASWLKWRKARMNLFQRAAFFGKCVGMWARIVRERLGTAGKVSSEENFTVTGAKDMGIDVKLADLLALCLVENDRRFAGYDARLRRPNFVPMMTRLTLPILRLLRI